MKPTAVIVFGLTLLAAASPALAQQHRPDVSRAGPQEVHRDGPDFRRDPSMGPPQGPPIGIGPPAGPRGRAGYDSLGADWGRQQNEAFEGVRDRRYVPLGRAIEEIRRRMPGDQLDAGLEQWGGRPAYRIRWATPNGRRIDYMVDAETGAILGPDGR